MDKDINANPGLINPPPPQRSTRYAELENALFLALPPNNGQPWSWDNEILLNNWSYNEIH